MITSLSIGRGGLGRMGNQMFTIAGCIGIARKSGQPFGFPHWKTYDNALFGQPVDDMKDYFVNPLPELPADLIIQDYGYFWGYRDIYLPSGSWTIDAHLQDPRFFEHCIDEVRNYFRMKDEQDMSDYTAVHLRFGDYIDDPNAYHPVCSKEYYVNAIEAIRQSQYDELLVFTDGNIDQVESRLGDYNYSIYKGNYIDSFKIMKKCKSFITANSSFSAMAAILGEHPDKKIVCPRRWFGPTAGITFEGYPQGAVII